MPKTWTEEQGTAINDIVRSDEHICLESVAGSGKTSVIVGACREIPRSVNAIVVAFNKSIARELEERLRGTPVKTGTFHSVCFQFVKSRMGKVEVDGGKCYNLVRKHVPEMKDAAQEIVRLVGLMKNNGLGLVEQNNDEIVEALRDNYDITHMDFADREIVAAARVVFAKSRKILTVLDFDDMIYFALMFIVEKGWAMDTYDLVIVDEFQDMNEVQLSLLAVMGNRIVGVGDTFQGIYGFRGAGTDTMEKARERWNMKPLTMSITFRCPVKVVEHAQQWVPYLKARPDAPAGVVQYLAYPSLWELLRPEECMVLCRNNFPLFSVAMQLLKEQKSFNMPGNYPKKLMGFVRSFKADDVQTFRVRLQDWWEEKQKELLAKKKMGALERENDKFQCLWEIQKQCVSVQEILNKLDSMMRASYGPVLTTIHGAKGLEADRILILEPELMPSKYAVTEVELQQEQNLMYVAATRAKEELYYIEGKHGTS